uniref:VWFA domain-containing protein n=1 Tax=Timema shepardi TaxID=629360 RepID=A0A7R9FUY6_TIMSH|nr:unnamed protein product [Timema shepardi]
MIVGALLMCLALDQSKLVDCNLKVSDAPIGGFFNAGQKKKLKDVESKLENSVLKSKVEMLGEALRKHVNSLKKSKKVELVFLVDASASVGEGNFASELKFVQKLLADFTVSVNDTRVSVITFASKGQVIRHVDHITFPSAANHKCVLLHHELPTIHYTGGGTYTLGAVLEAQSVLAHARPDAQQAVFLITDGFSNGGDPLPAAKQLKQSGATVFTFGIRNGNTRELYEMASLPAEEHSYILDSFGEFAALKRQNLQTLDNGALCRSSPQKFIGNMLCH